MKPFKDKLSRVWLAVCAYTYSAMTFAQIQRPKLPDGSEATDNFFGDIKKLGFGAGEVILILIAVVVFGAAAYGVVKGAIQGYSAGRWGDFWISIVVGVILVFIAIYFIALGFEALENLQ